MEDVTDKPKRRNRKSILQPEIDKLLEAENRERKELGLGKLSMETQYNENNVPLRIDESIRVNLSVTPEKWEKALKVGSEVEKLIKLDINPASSRFWYGLLDIVGDSLEVLQQKRNEAKDLQTKHDAIMSTFKFK